MHMHALGLMLDFDSIHAYNHAHMVMCRQSNSISGNTTPGDCVDHLTHGVCNLTT